MRETEGGEGLRRCEESSFCSVCCSRVGDVTHRHSNKNKLLSGGQVLLPLPQPVEARSALPCSVNGTRHWDKHSSVKEEEIIKRTRIPLLVFATEAQDVTISPSAPDLATRARAHPA